MLASVLVVAAVAVLIFEKPLNFQWTRGGGIGTDLKRLIQQNRPKDALGAVESMLLVAPAHAGSWREAGLLHSHLGNLRAAILAFENVMQLSDNDTLRHQVARQLQQLKSQLN